MYSFSNTKIELLYLPDSVETVGKHAFSECNNLVGVTLGSGMTEVPECMFYRCYNLCSFTFGPTVTKVANSAFNGCTTPLEIYFTGTEEQWDTLDLKISPSSGLPDIHFNSHIHDYASVVTPPTCISTGYTTYTCDCGESFEAQPVAKTTCTPGAEVFVKEPTCLNYGYSYYKCTVCGTISGQHNHKSPLDHAFDNGTVLSSPLCGTPGQIKYCCTRDDCSIFYIDEIPATGEHDFVDDFCTVCGSRYTVSSTEIVRLAGTTRYNTAFAAADELKSLLGVEKFSAIIVSSGTQFADALAGSYLASVKDAPILLVTDNPGVIRNVRDYIQENLVPGGTVYLLGGENAVPKAMESGLEDFTVTRLGGANRYDTNLLILKEAGVAGKDVIVCTGKNFADSLSASAVGLPILLVKDSLNETQKEFLQETDGDMIIIGGENAISKQVETQLATYGNVTRLAGINRYETSILVARSFFTAPGQAAIAYGGNFPDGLSGGPVANAVGAPMILTASGKEPPAAEYIAEHNLCGGYILGGTAVLPENSVSRIFNIY